MVETLVAFIAFGVQVIAWIALPDGRTSQKAEAQHAGAAVRGEII